MRSLKAKLRNLAFAAGILVAFSTAQAMCVYNKMDVGLEVDFDCGMLCGNTWSLYPNDYSCRSGKGGTLYGGGAGVSQLYKASVEEHGYAVMTTVTGGQRRVCVYRADDSLQDCLDFNYDPLHAGTKVLAPFSITMSGAARHDQRTIRATLANRLLASAKE